MRRAILLDRDGTLIEEVGFLTEVESVRMLPGSPGAIREANLAGFQTVLVTNQSAVARGMLDEARLAEIHDRVRSLLAEAEARLDAVYHCPHHPDAGAGPLAIVCGCRKPSPGLLHRARDEMGIDLARSYMIGDRITDLEAGAACGATPILVRTGYASQISEHDRSRAPEHHVADDFAAAVRWILETAS